MVGTSKGRQRLRLLWSSRLTGLTAGTLPIRINVDRLPSGVYYVQYRDELNHREHFARKVVIAR
jgi:hypothetical protein